MFNGLSLSSIFNSLIPATRFNKSGEPNRIFDEVREAKVKFVMKNDVPLCVLLSPEVFQEMADLQYQLGMAKERFRSEPASGNAPSASYYEEQASQDADDILADLDADVA